MPFKQGNKNRFKKGQSGNPSGRAKDELTCVLRKFMDKKQQVKGKKASKTLKELFVQKVVAMAFDGNQKCIEMIWDRIEGKPLQAIEHSGHIAENVIDMTKFSDKELRNLKKLQGKAIVKNITGSNVNTAK